MLVPGLGLDERSSSRLRTLVPGDVVRLPGMGRPGPVPQIDELARMLLAELGEGPVVLAGHSQSSQVVAAAASDPRVTGLVLFGPTTDPRMRPLAVLAARWLRTAAHEPPWQVRLVVAQYRRTGPRAMAALWRRAAPDRIDARLRSIAVPVTVVRGTRDWLCPHDWAARLAATAPRGRLVEIAGAAHMTVQAHPEACAAVLSAATGGSPGGY